MNEDEIKEKIKHIKSTMAPLKVGRARYSMLIKEKKAEIDALQAEIDKIHSEKESEILRKCFPDAIPREEVQ